METKLSAKYGTVFIYLDATNVSNLGIYKLRERKSVLMKRFVATVQALMTHGNVLRRTLLLLLLV